MNPPSPNSLDLCDEALLEHLRQAVYWACRRFHYRPRNGEIEDICQAICLLLLKNDYRSLHSFNPQKGKLTTWLQTIANHEVLHCLRRQGNGQMVDAEFDASIFLPSQENALLLKEQKVMAQAAAFKLSPNEQQLFWLLCQDEPSDSEKAKRMSISFSAFRKRKHHLIVKLRVLIGLLEEPRSRRRNRSRKKPALISNRLPAA
jgi:RNA polymerase sigma factor (sigma-70 family)